MKCNVGHSRSVWQWIRAEFREEHALFVRAIKRGAQFFQTIVFEVLSERYPILGTRAASIEWPFLIVSFWAGTSWSTPPALPSSNPSSCRIRARGHLSRASNLTRSANTAELEILRVFLLSLCGIADFHMEARFLLVRTRLFWKVANETFCFDPEGKFWLAHDVELAKMVHGSKSTIDALKEEFEKAEPPGASSELATSSPCCLSICSFRGLVRKCVQKMQNVLRPVQPSFPKEPEGEKATHRQAAH